MSGINSVAPRVQGGLLDTVLKGVSIARDIYGIKHDMAATDAAETQTAGQQQAQAQSAAKFSDEQAGVLSPKDHLEWSRNYDKATDPKDPAGVDVRHRTGPGEEGIVTDRMIPHQTKSALATHVIANTVDPKTGKTGAGIVDSSGSLMGFVETKEKPVKTEPTGHWKLAGFNPAGDPISQNDLTGEYKVGDIGPVNKRGGGPAAEGVADAKVINRQKDKLYDTFVKGGAKSEVGALKAKVDIAENLKGIVEAHPDGNLPPPLQTELAIGMAKMVGGGVPTQAEIEKMDPQTRGTFVANLMQKFTNEPYGAGNPGFVKLFEETIDREKGIAKDQIGRVVQQAMSYATDYYKKDPKGFHGMVGIPQDQFEISPTGDFAYVNKTIGKKGEQKTDHGDGATAIAGPAAKARPQAAFHEQAQSAEQWAAANPSDPRAKEILRRIQDSDQPDTPTPGGGRP